MQCFAESGGNGKRKRAFAGPLSILKAMRTRLIRMRIFVHGDVLKECAVRSARRSTATKGARITLFYTPESSVLGIERVPTAVVMISSSFISSLIIVFACCGLSKSSRSASRENILPTAIDLQE